jgi:hypothetical protein
MSSSPSPSLCGRVVDDDGEKVMWSEQNRTKGKKDWPNVSVSLLRINYERHFPFQLLSSDVVPHGPP